MIIQHNISALNSYRNLTNNNSAVSSNLEKLSSGYAINRAGDDAAGLAISEKMRAQITGLETAQKNANDGISLVQTAEGALQEVHTMLNRMVELAQQSANGTYQDEVDRENLESELTSLKDEINRISESTNFNGINLLDGSLGGSTKAIVFDDSALKTAGAVFEGQAYAGTIDAGLTATTQTVELTYTVNGEEKTVKIEYEGSTTTDTAVGNFKKAIEDAGLGDVFNITTTAGNKTVTLTSKVNGNEGAVITSGATKTKDAIDAGYKFGAAMAAGDSITVDGKTYTYGTVKNDENRVFTSVAEFQEMLKADGYKLVQADDGKDTATMDTDTVLVRDPDADKGLTLQIGDTSDDFNQLTVNVSSVDTKTLGIDGISIKDQTSAKAAVDVIKAAINKVSSTRGDLGAIQNRLEHTINNLSVTTENMTAAESRIRDVDMAKEMMEYTKNNILVQSSQAMLAQANQIPQGVLQLLQ